MHVLVAIVNMAHLAICKSTTVLAPLQRKASPTLQMLQNCSVVFIAMCKIMSWLALNQQNQRML